MPRLLLTMLVTGCSDPEPACLERAGDYSALGSRSPLPWPGATIPAAYAITSSEYQRSTTIDEMRTAFEAIVPPQWPAV